MYIIYIYICIYINIFVFKKKIIIYIYILFSCRGLHSQDSSLLGRSGLRMQNWGSWGCLFACIARFSAIIPSAIPRPYRSTNQVLSRITCFPLRLCSANLVAFKYVALMSQFFPEANQSSNNSWMIFESQLVKDAWIKIHNDDFQGPFGAMLWDYAVLIRISSFRVIL